MSILRSFIVSLALIVPSAALADSAVELCEGDKEHKEAASADKSEPKKEDPKAEKAAKEQQQKKQDTERAGKS